MHNDALADGIAGFRVVLDEVVIDRIDITMAEGRAVTSDMDCSMESSACRGERGTLVL